MLLCLPSVPSPELGSASTCSSEAHGSCPNIFPVPALGADNAGGRCSAVFGVMLGYLISLAVNRAQMLLI